ncbi:MAG: hypothetical protein WAT18_00540, partial [Sphingorhabdus sp.]
CRRAMSGPISRGKVGAALVAVMLISVPSIPAAWAQDVDPNDAFHCIEIIGIRGFSVRINNRCGFALRLATCVEGSMGSNACDKGGQQEMFPVPANARDHTILDMQVNERSAFHVVACKDPWTPGNPHMQGGEYQADECAW